MKKPTLNKLNKLAKEFKKIKTFDYEDFTLTVKQYITIQEKKSLVEDVVMRCIVENDGQQYIHTYISHIAKSCAIIRFYTNIELPDDNFEAYDMLNRIPEIYNQALNMMPDSELKEIDMMIDKFIEDYKFNQAYSNSVETVVKQALDKLVAKLPSLEEANKFIESASKEIGSFDPSKLNFVKDFIKANNGVELDGRSKDI